MARTGDRGGTETRDRIAASAARLFLDRGFEAVTVADVARQAGVSSVTVFKHFPRKEDLFLDRAEDADELLAESIRERGAGMDVLAALQDLSLRLVDEHHPLSGLDERSLPFFRTIAASPTLLGRARELAAGLQQTLTDELEADARFEGDPALLAALFVAGYATTLLATARTRIAGEQDPEASHRLRLDRLFTALRQGVPS